MEGEAPPVVDTAPVATPEPTTEPTTDPTTDTADTSSGAPVTEGPTSYDDEDESEDSSEDAEAKEKRIRENLDQEVSQVGDTLENRATNTFVAKFTTTEATERDQLMRENPGQQLLRTRHEARAVIQVSPGKIHLLTSDQSGKTARYKTSSGDSILGVIHVATARDGVTSDTDTLTVRVINGGKSNDVSMPRAELLDLMYQTDKDLILATYPAEDRPLMEKYYVGLSGKEKDDEHYTDLPELITQTAESHNIPTTGRLTKALERQYANVPIPTDASPEDTERITADNARKAELITEIKTKLEGNNLASPEQLKMSMDLLGITPKNLTTILETTRIQSEQLRKAIESEQDAGKKAEYKTQLDTIDATAQIYQEIQGMLAADPEGKYAEKFLESQRAGNVSAELAKSIAESLDKGEIETLIHMVSPETSITATAEEKRKFREAREKQTKILKGLGLAAALAALLLALGISQGAKQ